LTVSETPVYLSPETQNRFWLELSEWNSFQITVYGSTPCLRTKTPKEIKINTVQKSVLNPFSSLPTVLTHSQTIQNIECVQKSDIYPENPISIGLPIPVSNELVVKIADANRHKGSYLLNIEHVEGLELAEFSRPLLLQQKENEITIRFPLKSLPAGNYKFSVNAKELQNDHFWTIFPLQTMKLVDDFSSRNAETL